MIVIGITGGIASGKSVASNVCKKYDAYIFDADEEAKKLLFTKEISRKFDVFKSNLDFDMMRKQFSIGYPQKIIF